MFLLSLLGCDPPAPPPPAPDRAVAEAKAEVLQQHATPASLPAAPVDAPPVQVVLVWSGISPLYKSFFSNTEAATELATGLAGLVGSPADVYIRYDSEELLGDIQLRLRPGLLQQPVRVTGDRIQLQDLTPITAALAAYRSSIAARFDIRVESFQVGIESFRGAQSCQFSIAGPPPPDGRLISPCVEITGTSVCGEPGVDGVLFPPEIAQTIRRCLDQ